MRSICYFHTIDVFIIWRAFPKVSYMKSPYEQKTMIKLYLGFTGNVCCWCNVMPSAYYHLSSLSIYISCGACTSWRTRNLVYSIRLQCSCSSGSCFLPTLIVLIFSVRSLYMIFNQFSWEGYSTTLASFTWYWGWLGDKKRYLCM